MTTVSYHSSVDGYRQVEAAVGTGTCGEAISKTREAAVAEAGRPVPEAGLSAANLLLVKNLSLTKGAVSTASVPLGGKIIEATLSGSVCYVRVPVSDGSFYGIRVPSERSWADGEMFGVLVAYYRKVRREAKSGPPGKLPSEEVSAAFGES